MCSANTEGDENETDVDRLEGENNRTFAPGRFGGISSESILSAVHFARANIAAHSFTTELPRNRQWFSIHRFFGESGMKRKRVYDEDNMS